MTLLACLAALALLLAAVGIYGLIANSVVERTRELGVRMALGATVRQAIAAVVMPGIVMAAVGVGLGAALALGASRVVRNLLWGISTSDPRTFAAVGALLFLVAVIASAIPALRITRLNPATTLRDE
jgi:ABC-type antimicrobial peptide transport system permease subunit